MRHSMMGGTCATGQLQAWS